MFILSQGRHTVTKKTPERQGDGCDASGFGEASLVEASGKPVLWQPRRDHVRQRK